MTILTACGLGTPGCASHDNPNYRHDGFYDEKKVWHGGYYDEDRRYHEDAADWHK